VSVDTDVASAVTGLSGETLPSRPGAPSSLNPVGHVDGFGPTVLAEDMGVRVQGHGRRVAELLGEFDDRGALFADQQRGERVAEVVWAGAAEARSSRGGCRDFP
jgi:hypothetical protein